MHTMSTFIEIYQPWSQIRFWAVDIEPEYICRIEYTSNVTFYTLSRYHVKWNGHSSRYPQGQVSNGQIMSPPIGYVGNLINST